MGKMKKYSVNGYQISVLPPPRQELEGELVA